MARTEFLEGNEIYCFISKFGRFKNLSAIINMSKLVLDRFTLLVQTRSDCYEFWQTHKQLKTMEMNKASPERSMNPHIKFETSSRNTCAGVFLVKSKLSHNCTTFQSLLGYFSQLPNVLSVGTSSE